MEKISSRSVTCRDNGTHKSRYTPRNFHSRPPRSSVIPPLRFRFLPAAFLKAITIPRYIALSAIAHTLTRAENHARTACIYATCNLNNARWPINKLAIFSATFLYSFKFSIQRCMGMREDKNFDIVFCHDATRHLARQPVTKILTEKKKKRKEKKGRKIEYSLDRRNSISISAWEVGAWIFVAFKHAWKSPPTTTSRGIGIFPPNTTLVYSPLLPLPLPRSRQTR